MPQLVRIENVRSIEVLRKSRIKVISEYIIYHVKNLIGIGGICSKIEKCINWDC